LGRHVDANDACKERGGMAVGNVDNLHGPVKERARRGREGAVGRKRGPRRGDIDTHTTLVGASIWREVGRDGIAGARGVARGGGGRRQ
jgi:hypothetical protein